MKILVTGGAGFVGSALTTGLSKLGHSVDILDNNFVRTHIPEGVANVIIQNITERLDYAGYDVIYHLAAVSRIQYSFDQPRRTFKTNVDGTEMICAYAHRNKTKLIYVSSSSVHNNPLQSPYSISKWIGEEMVKMYHNVYGVNAQIARLYNVYGPGELSGTPFDAVIGKWHHNVNYKQPIEIVGDGTQRRDFTHIDDIVDGLIKLLTYESTKLGEWEFGTNNNYSLNEVAYMFQNKFLCEIKHIENQNGNYPNSLRVNDNALTELNWKPIDKLKKYINGL